MSFIQAHYKELVHVHVKADLSQYPVRKLYIKSISGVSSLSG